MLNSILDPKHLSTLTEAGLNRLVAEEAERLTTAWATDTETASDTYDTIDDVMVNLVRLQAALVALRKNGAYTMSVVEAADDAGDYDEMAQVILANVVAA